MGEGAGAWAAGLLGLTAVLTLAPPRRVPRWVPAVVGAVVAVGSGLVGPGSAWVAVRPLAGPLAFLVLAVPLALMLDRVGFFEAAAARVGGGRRLRPALWVLAAAVTAFLNLDTAVVLLTPLYVRIARRHGLDPVATAFMPVLLASLASGLLPVSNLTNLIVAERQGLGAVAFVGALGLPTLAAVGVGWWSYRRTFLVGVAPVVVADPVDRTALGIGLPVVGWLVVAFTVGDHLGVPAWVAVLAADVWLAARLRRVRPLHLPWDAVALVTGLAVVAAAFTAHHDVTGRLAVAGPLDALGVVAGSVVAANLVNNLPALLVGLDGLGPDASAATWALLLGVNLGPVLVVSGSLAGLLWMSTLRRLGLEVTPLDYSRVGARVGLPALAAATAVWVALQSLAGW